MFCVDQALLYMGNILKCDWYVQWYSIRIWHNMIIKDIFLAHRSVHHSTSIWKASSYSRCELTKRFKWDNV